MSPPEASEEDEMYDFMPPEAAAVLGLFMGCLARAILPFFKKKYQEANAGIK